MPCATNHSARAAFRSICIHYISHYSQQCDSQADRLDIGGTSGLDSTGMEVASSVCGVTPKKQLPNKEIVPDGQAIFCGVTTVRLISSGRLSNEARISMRPADDVDMSIATMVCAM